MSLRANKIIFVVGPPRCGSSMTAALLHTCGAWGRVWKSVTQSGFHLSVMDACILIPVLNDQKCGVVFQQTVLPTVPCANSGLDVPNFANRLEGALLQAGYTSGTAVLRSHVLLPFIPHVAERVPSSVFVMVHRDPACIKQSAEATLWMQKAGWDWGTYAGLYNTEMDRYAALIAEERVVQIHPQLYIDGDVSELADAVCKLGLAWSDDTSLLLDNLNQGSVP